MTTRVEKLLQREGGIFLDLGCGGHKEPNAIGMDKRALPTVDIVHDLETFPWPLPDASCFRILASHLFEHLKPWLMLEIMAECHRVLKDHAQLLIAMPYPGSPRFWQDPTHVKAWNEATADYFDCTKPLWGVYEVPCWKIEMNQWNSIGDMQIILSKRAGPHGAHTEPEAPKD
jgi:SAM-dependent methyltransferase